MTLAQAGESGMGNLCRFFLGVRGPYFIGEQSVATKTPNTLAFPEANRNQYQDERAVIWHWST